MTLPVYSTGTVAVAAGGTVVTGTGVMWSGINAKQGDFISIAGSAAVLITEVTDATHLKIPPWQGAAQSGAAYLLYQNYVGRVVGVAAAEDVGVMLEKLHTDGLPFIVGTGETAPDPSYGDEGQFAFQPSTGKWWVKSGGVWVLSPGLTALGYGGTSATSLTIGTGAKVFTTQAGLAYNGARVRAASAANVNNWMEGVASYTGTILTMTADLTNGAGTFADWLFSIAGVRGAQGPQGIQGVAGGTFGDAPSDTKLYGRQSATVGGAMGWAEAASTGTVRYDVVQALTSAQRLQARQNIAAAPFDALAANGMQINGSFDVNQEFGSGAVVFAAGSIAKYATDGTQVLKAGTLAFTIQQTASIFPGYSKEFKLTVTTAQPAIGSDYIILEHEIEGYRFAKAMWGTASAVPVSVGFWVKSSVAGVARVSIFNDGFANSSDTTITIAAANVPQWITATLAAMTSATWDNTTAAGARLRIYAAITGQINIAATNGNTFEMTGLIVLPGVDLPSSDRAPFIMRPINQELALCQRYWRKFGGVSALDVFLDGYASASSVTLPTTYSHFGMRVVPSWTPVGTFNIVNTPGPTFIATPDTTVMYCASSAAGQVRYFNNAGAYLAASARIN